MFDKLNQKMIEKHYNKNLKYLDSTENNDKTDNLNFIQGKRNIYQKTAIFYGVLGFIGSFSMLGIENIGFYIFISGCIVSFIGTLFLYGLGELVDEAKESNFYLKKISKK